MRHLLVRGKIKISLHPTKTLEKDPHTDVSFTVKNFAEQKEFKENQVHPEAVEHGIKEEKNAKCLYSKFSEKQHCSLIFRSQVSLLVAVILG